METNVVGSGLHIHMQQSINLQHTLFCGQVFRWRQLGEDAFFGVAGTQAVHLRQLQQGFAITPCTPQQFESFWRRYFDLDFDYAACCTALGADETMGNMARACAGLHLLNQPVWECLLSFIVSANNNIGRIRGSMEAMAEAAGTPLGQGTYATPTPQQICSLSEAQLRACGLGYRAPYALHTARAVAEGFDLQALAGLPYEQAKKQLMTLKGVGEKVADCVLLFSCGHREAFPVDVWVDRAMRRAYPHLTGSRATIGQFARATYGPYAGLAQQYLFHTLRNLERGEERA